MKKMKIKCAIGATILTPIILILFVALLVGMDIFFKAFPIVLFIMSSIIGIFILIIIWYSIYECCKNKKENK